MISTIIIFSIQFSFYSKTKVERMEKDHNVGRKRFKKLR